MSLVLFFVKIRCNDNRSDTNKPCHWYTLSIHTVTRRQIWLIQSHRTATATRQPGFFSAPVSASHLQCLFSTDKKKRFVPDANGCRFFAFVSPPVSARTTHAEATLPPKTERKSIQVWSRPTAPKGYSTKRVFCVFLRIQSPPFCHSGVFIPSLLML